MLRRVKIAAAIVYCHVLLLKPQCLQQGTLPWEHNRNPFVLAQHDQISPGSRCCENGNTVQVKLPDWRQTCGPTGQTALPFHHVFNSMALNYHQNPNNPLKRSTHQMITDASGAGVESSSHCIKKSPKYCIVQQGRSPAVSRAWNPYLHDMTRYDKSIRKTQEIVAWLAAEARVVTKFLWLWNGFLIWKKFGRVSSGLDILRKGLVIWKEFGKIWKGFLGHGICRRFCASGRGSKGHWWTLGWVICLEQCCNVTL